MDERWLSRIITHVVWPVGMAATAAVGYAVAVPLSYTVPVILGLVYLATHLGASRGGSQRRDLA